MPIYEYECGVCDFHFDKRQKFHDEPVAACPKCQGKARRVFRPVPIIFKGSGFYITDNRKGVASESVASKEEAPSKKKERKEKQGESAPTESH